METPASRLAWIQNVNKPIVAAGTTPAIIRTLKFSKPLNRGRDFQSTFSYYMGIFHGFSWYSWYFLLTVAPGIEWEGGVGGYEWLDDGGGSLITFPGIVWGGGG